MTLLLKTVILIYNVEVNVSKIVPLQQNRKPVGQAPVPVLLIAIMTIVLKHNALLILPTSIDRAAVSLKAHI